MKHPHFTLAPLASLLCLMSIFGTAFAHSPASVTANEALQKLEQGNSRFVAGRLSESTPAAIAQMRNNVAQAQNPFAIVVGCSDSRVGPEVIFDQKIGDLFVIRTAGEVVDSVGLGSIEYAVEHLGTQLIVVLGHERCGAVSAAVSGAKEPGHIGAVLKAIKPAVTKTKHLPGDPVENAVRAHALDVASQLSASSPILKNAVQSGKLKIVAARYDLDSGKVSLLPASQN